MGKFCLKRNLHRRKQATGKWVCASLSCCSCSKHSWLGIWSTYVLWCGIYILQHYQSSRECCIQMSLLESNHLMISSGTQVYVSLCFFVVYFMHIESFMQESFSLWNGQKWIKGITKGDSILFIYKLDVCTHTCSCVLGLIIIYSSLISHWYALLILYTGSES